MEIEKKFKVKYLPDNYDKNPKFVIEQGYLCSKPTLRIRRRNDEYILTYKSVTGEAALIDSSICASNEYEHPLSDEAYYHLKEKIDNNMVEKCRYNIELEDGLIAELDIFSGILEGLVIVEVEFLSEEAALKFAAPDWFGDDVSKDGRYKNFRMSRINSREEVEMLI